MPQSETRGTSLRAAIRAASPARLRVAVAVARRMVRDFPIFGQRLRFAGQSAALNEGLEHRIVEAGQEIKRSAFYQGKLANIRLGARRLDGVVIRPGEIMSFWKLVGRPSRTKGFEVGRSIRGGEAVGDLGGGLCQLSGITYEAGLRAGLDPVERHPHSRDLYAEADRFTPLGLDATVVWPYKDLRLRNGLGVPVQFRFQVTDATILAGIYAPAPVAEARLEITRVDDRLRREVQILRQIGDAGPQLISKDSYTALPG